MVDIVARDRPNVKNAILPLPTGRTAIKLERPRRPSPDPAAHLDRRLKPARRLAI
jgi:hypothetical protein